MFTHTDRLSQPLSLLTHLCRYCQAQHLPADLSIHLDLFGSYAVSVTLRTSLLAAHRVPLDNIALSLDHYAAHAFVAADFSSLTFSPLPELAHLW